MGNYPHEVENVVPQLPGHIAIGVIFPGDFGSFNERCKMYVYWAPARYVRHLNSDVAVVVRGVVKHVRVVSIAPEVKPGAKFKCIKTAEKPPAHLSESYPPLRAVNQPYEEYFSALSEALGLKTAEAAARACRIRVATFGRQCRDYGIPSYFARMGSQAEAFATAVEGLRARTEDQPIVFTTKLGTSNTSSTPYHPSNLELIMSKPSLSITTVTYINGVDVSILGNDEVFTILQDLRVRIERLESLPLNMRPTRITAELEQLRRTADEIVELLNKIDAEKEAAKRSETDALRAIVKEEVQSQVKRVRASDLPAMPVMPDEGS